MSRRFLHRSCSSKKFKKTGKMSRRFSGRSCPSSKALWWFASNNGWSGAIMQPQSSSSLWSSCCGCVFVFLCLCLSVSVCLSVSMSMSMSLCVSVFLCLCAPLQFCNAGVWLLARRVPGDHWWVAREPDNSFFFTYFFPVDIFLFRFARN